MTSLNYYHLATLPTLAEPGEPVEITGRELLCQLAEGGEDSQAGTLVKTILLSDDLIQRDCILSGQDITPQLSVLSMEQIEDQELLPDYLFCEPSDHKTIPSDLIWESYFRYADTVAQDLNSVFLATWVRYEVSLRNGMAEKRAQDLGLDPADYMVATELSTTDVSADTGRWTSGMSNDPLAGQKALDAARWEHLDETEPYYSFGDDEIGAYAARLVIAIRWARIDKSINTNIQEQNRTEQ